MQEPKTPKYRRHCASGRDRAFVELDGQRYYIGRYGSRESRQRYDQLVAEWLASGRHRPGEAHEITKAHLDEVNDKIARLTALRDELEAMVACDNRQISECRIIEVLADHGKCQHRQH